MRFNSRRKPQFQDRRRQRHISAFVTKTMKMVRRVTAFFSVIETNLNFNCMKIFSTTDHTDQDTKCLLRSNFTDNRNTRVDNEQRNSLHETHFRRQRSADYLSVHVCRILVQTHGGNARAHAHAQKFSLSLSPAPRPPSTKLTFFCGLCGAASYSYVRLVPYVNRQQTVHVLLSHPEVRGADSE